MLVSSNLHCQENEDVLYLKDGSVIRGSILEIQKDTVRIVTVGRNVFVYSMQQVKKMQKEDIAGSSRQKGIKKEGYFVSIQPGFFIGSDNFGYSNNANVVSGSFQMVHDYLFEQRISAGIGFGIEGFGQTVMPIFADFNYFFLKQATSPYVYGRGGYSLSMERNGGTGGPMVGLGIGVRKYMGVASGVLFKFGYRYQTVDRDYWNGIYQIYSKDIYHRLSLGFGFFF